MIEGSSPCDRSRAGKKKSTAAVHNIFFVERDFIFPMAVFD
jgi:hypothetical protein